MKRNFLARYRLNRLVKRAYRVKAPSLPMASDGKWWQTSWDDPWSVVGAAGMAPLGGLAGVAAANGIASKLGWDENGFARNALRTVLGVGGLVGGAYLGKWGMAPFQAGGHIGQKYIAPKLGKGWGTGLGIAAGMGLSIPYSMATGGALEGITSMGNRAYLNSGMSTNDAYAYYQQLRNMGYDSV